MTETRKLSQVADTLTPDELMSVLMDMTGDLDKAQVLHDTLPGWMVKADSRTLRALHTAYVTSQRLRVRAAQVLNRLKPLQALCAERLEAFLLSKGVDDVDVEHDALEVPRRSLTGVTPYLGGSLIETIALHTQSLLQAAMQNFAPDQARPDGLPSLSAIRSAQTGEVIQGMTASQFVEYCRELDLGEVYQRHIREVFNLAEPAEGAVDAERGYNPAVTDIGQARTQEMLIDLHIAYGKGDIGKAGYEVLQKVIEADLPASELRHLQWNNKPLIWRGVNVDNACLWTVLVFADASFDGPLLVYMPNEPVRPWFEYPVLEDFTRYLGLKLHVPSYRSFFRAYLDESERLDFYQRFDKAATLGRLDWLPVTRNLSTFFFNGYVGKLQLDALELAVPTAQVDEQARQQRLQKYQEIGLTLLNIAGFVVPVLGQLMMGVAVGQLLGEVYEGVEELTHDNRSAALEHLINVAESVASMLLFAAGGRVVGTLKRSLMSSTPYFDTLQAVRRPDFKPRLWPRRLDSYGRPREIESMTVANAKGVYQLNGQSFVNVRGTLYAIAFDPGSSQWRIRHPLREMAYRPPLSNNGQGGWLHDFEQPEHWSDVVYSLRRLDPGLTEIPSRVLQDIATTTELSLPKLQRLAMDHAPLPQRFLDCLARYRQHSKVLALGRQLALSTPPDASTGRTQLLALPLMPGWPQGRFFEVLDAAGNVKERYPDTAPFDYEDLSIHITEQQLKDAQVMDTLLSALDAEERTALLGAATPVEQAREALQRRLHSYLGELHRPLYEKLYQEYDTAGRGDHGLLKAHYPHLPSRVAWELLCSTRATQRWHLRNTRRVPLLLAQRTRVALEVLEEDQAMMGLYFPEIATEASHRLALGLLGQMPGWPTDLVLHVRSETLTGPVLGEVGDALAALKRTVVKSAKGFQALDARGKPLAPVAMGPEGWFQAIVDTLSPRQLTALGITSRTQGAMRLHSKLVSQAEDERALISRYLWPQRPRPQALVSCIQAAPPEPPAAQPAALVRKARQLYPGLNEQEVASFLEGLGPDHLARAKAIQALEQQFEALHRSLKLWCADTTSLMQLPDPLWDYRVSRFHVMEELEACWKQLTVLSNEFGQKIPGLELDGRVMGRLPTLAPDVTFAHVQHLSLKRLRLSDDIAYFLKHFKAVRILELSGNQLTRLPEILSQMPNLQRLYLDNNRLQLTEYTRAKLAGLHQLRVLDLSDNPLVDPPDVARMFGLRNLLLRNCRLKELPAALWRLPNLEQVDVRENEISQLPGWLANTPRRFASSLNLRHNPLDTPSRLLLSNYRKKYGIGMGFLEDDIARLNEQRARALWLEDEVSALDVEKNNTWIGLRDEPGSDGLFKLLAEIGGSADARLVREDMQRRVWRVLQATAEDAELREEVFQRAATPINCDDAAALNFSSLEVLVEIRDASRRVEGGHVTAGPLLRLARGLFRLDQLERIAREHSDEHPSADPLEVSLAFRTGLVDRFHLPGQPSHMLYARLGGVTQGNLSRAENQLRFAELSSAPLDYIAELPFWNAYLKRTFNAQFETMNAPYDQRMQALFDQSLTLKDEAYRTQMNQVLQEQTATEKTLLIRLTDAALKAEDQELCAAALL